MYVYIYIYSRIAYPLWHWWMPHLRIPKRTWPTVLGSELPFSNPSCSSKLQQR